MAIKKFAKPMKIATVFVALALIIPSLAGLYNFVINRETKTVMLKVDGQKIYKEDFELKYSELSTKLVELEKNIKQAKNIKDEEYKAMPEEVLKSYILAQFIQEKLNDSLANNLGIKVSKSEVTKKYTEFEENFGGNRNLVAAIQQQGLTIADFREQLKEQLINEKRLKEIQSKITITDEEITDMYNRLKYSTYEFKTLEESKEEIRNTIAFSKAKIYESSLIEKTLNDAKFKYVDEASKVLVDKLLEKVYDDGTYEIKLINVISEHLNKYLEFGLGYTEEFLNNFKDLVKQDIEKQIRIKDLALNAGLKINEDLLPKFQLQYILADYINYLSKTYNPSEDEMKALYSLHSDQFDIKHTVSGSIIGITLKADEKDFADYESVAKDIMKSITSENFEEKAKELSKDPGSAANGGNLGKADVTRFVPEFKDALLNGKVGEILGPIKTQFGYHIIEILSKDEKNSNIVESRHILLVPEAKNAKETAMVELNKIKELLETSKIKWDDINSDKTGKYDKFDIIDNFNKVTKDSSIGPLGYNKEFNEKLFSSKVGEFLINEDANSYILVQKTDEIPFKKVTFEEAKDKIKLILTNMYIANHLREI